MNRYVVYKSELTGRWSIYDDYTAVVYSYHTWQEAVTEANARAHVERLSRQLISHLDGRARAILQDGTQ